MKSEKAETERRVKKKLNPLSLKRLQASVLTAQKYIRNENTNGFTIC